MKTLQQKSSSIIRSAMNKKRMGAAEKNENGINGFSPPNCDELSARSGTGSTMGKMLFSIWSEKFHYPIADAGRRGHHCGDNHDTVGSPAGCCGRKLSTAIIELSQLSVAWRSAPTRLSPIAIRANERALSFIGQPNGSYPSPEPYRRETTEGYKEPSKTTFITSFVIRYLKELDEFLVPTTTSLLPATSP